MAHSSSAKKYQASGAEAETVAWTKLHSKEWLYGRIRNCAPEIRSVWTDIQAQADESPVRGTVCAAPEVGYPIAVLAAMWKTPESVVRAAIDIFTGEDWISLDTTGVIHLTEWLRFQDEYQRLKKYTVKNTEKNTVKSTVKNTEKYTPKSTPQIQIQIQKELNTTGSKPPVFQVNGQDIPGSFWGMVVYKYCNRDEDLAARLFFRAEHAKAKNVIEYIRAGIVRNGYLWKACTAEDTDPGIVRDWIDKVVYRIGRKSQMSKVSDILNDILPHGGEGTLTKGVSQ